MPNYCMKLFLIFEAILSTGFHFKGEELVISNFIISIFCTSLFLIYASLNDNALKEINRTMYLYRTTSNNVR